MGFVEWFAELSIYEQVAGVALSALFLLCVILRVLLFVSFHIAIKDVYAKSLKIKTKEDIEKLGMGALRRTAREYLILAGAGSKVDAYALAEGSIYKNPIWVFNFASIHGFIKALEWAFLPIAILLIVALLRFEFAVFFAALYLLLRIIALFCDMDTIKERYVRVLAHALVVQVGQFFPEDKSAAVYNFSSDLNEYLQRQSAMFSELLTKISGEFMGSIKTSVSTMTKVVEATMSNVSQEASKMQLSEKNAALEEVLTTAQKNQETLAVSVAEYQASLKAITAQIGTALGENIAHHMANASGRFADEISENLQASKIENAEQAKELREIFAQIAQQNQVQTQLLMDLLKGDDDE